MNIDIINENIHDLENEETTYKNIQELAYLYIVRSNFKETNHDNVTKELNDILPCYTRYIKIKRDYQMGKITDDFVIQAMEDVCKEIEEFVLTLYFNTEFLKERLKIKKMIESLNSLE